MARWPAALLCLAWAVSAPASEGQYLFNAAGCLACHTAEDGQPLAGGRAFDTAFGTFYSPNITPDPQSGIGGWTRTEFVRALKHGTAPNGSAYFPVFPYTSYRLMTDQDAGLIFDYLLTRAPVRRSNREHDLAWWLGRWTMKPWQWWVQEDPAPGPADPMLGRGRYLVDALGHCTECHTPRNWLGLPDRSRYLAGSATGPGGGKMPNITPDRESGIGKWDADDLDYFLESGELPNGDYTGGMMTEVVDNTTSKLTADDRSAIVNYLRSVIPIPGSARRLR